jgi:TIR domain.
MVNVKEIEDMRKKINIFISYAHRNEKTVVPFIEEFKEYITPSKKYDYNVWYDSDIMTGEKWEQRILNEIEKCDLGVLMMSPSFLNSKFIMNTELPLLQKGKVILPIMMRKLDFARHDLKGIDQLQIFTYEGKAYSELRAKSKAKFVEKAFEKMEELLDSKLK